MSSKEHLQYTPEPPTVSLAFVGWSALGALMLLGITIGTFHGIYRHAAPIPISQPPATFPEPRVDTHQAEELRRVRDAQKRRLEAWDWADSGHTLVEIPIERAMQLLAMKGNDAYRPLLPADPALSSPAAAAEKTVIQGGHSQGSAPGTDHSPLQGRLK